MKKFLVALVLVGLMAGTVLADGTVTVTSDHTFTASGIPTVREIVLTCVGDASDGSIPDTTLYNMTNLAKPLTGWYLLRIKIKNVAAEANVTDNSDVYIKDSDGVDYLNGDGVDQLDDSTTNYIRLGDYDPIADNPVLDVDNQSVVSGKYYITLILGI